MVRLRFRDLDSLVPLLCISQPDGRMEVWVSEWMDGPSLGGGKEGRAGWREVVLEMEEKKRGGINLTEGRLACLSLPASLSRHTHTHTHEYCTETQAPYPLQPFLSVSSGPMHHVRSRTHKSEGLS